MNKLAFVVLVAAFFAVPLSAASTDTFRPDTPSGISPSTTTLPASSTTLPRTSTTTFPGASSSTASPAVDEVMGEVVAVNGNRLTIRQASDGMVREVLVNKSVIILEDKGTPIPFKSTLKGRTVTLLK